MAAAPPITIVSQTDIAVALMNAGYDPGRQGERVFEALRAFLNDFGYPASYRTNADSVMFFDGAEGAGEVLAEMANVVRGRRVDENPPAGVPPLAPPMAERGLAALSPTDARFVQGVALGAAGALVAGMLVVALRNGARVRSIAALPAESKKDSGE